MGFGNEIWNILNYMGYLDMLFEASALSPDTAQLIKEQWYLPLEGIGCLYLFSAHAWLAIACLLMFII